MKQSVAVIGCQDGDEGKGKIVDFTVQTAVSIIKNRISEEDGSIQKPILVRRFQGGSNAGHTLNVGGNEYKLHLIPSGIITPQAYNLIGRRVYFNPRKGKQEIEQLRELGVKITPEDLGIAANAHCTLDYHVEDDQAAFSLDQHTSTGNGIKPTAVDKYGRVGIRFIDFLDPEVMRKILTERRFPEQKFPFNGLSRFIDSYYVERKILEPFLVDEHQVLHREGISFLIDEGAQGVGLDIDDGAYPGITSSSPALAPRESRLVLGVFKLYKSSVGTGDRPFVSRMGPELETRLRNLWNEYGVTTKKARDLGWFDALAGKYAVQAAGVDFLALTCGDRLEAIAQTGETVKLAVAYKLGRKTYDCWDLQFYKQGALAEAKPVFEEFAPWEEFTDKTNQKLTPNARRYIDRIQELLDTEIALIGTGPAREQMIVYEKIFSKY